VREDKGSEGGRGNIGAISIWLAFKGYINDQ